MSAKPIDIYECGSEIVLPKKQGHGILFAHSMWSEEEGWRVQEDGSGRRTKRHVSEEEAIRAARRREWVR